MQFWDGQAVTFLLRIPFCLGKEQVMFTRNDTRGDTKLKDNSVQARIPAIALAYEHRRQSVKTQP